VSCQKLCIKQIYMSGFFFAIHTVVPAQCTPKQMNPRDKSRKLIGQSVQTLVSGTHSKKLVLTFQQTTAGCPLRRHDNHLWIFPKPAFHSRVSSRLQQPVAGALSAAPWPLSTRLTDFSDAALTPAVAEVPVCSPRVERDDEPRRGGDRGR
jgi:hypothetical protein